MSLDGAGCTDYTSHSMATTANLAMEYTVGSVSQAPCWKAHAVLQFPAGSPTPHPLLAVGLLPVRVTQAAKVSSILVR